MCLARCGGGGVFVVVEGDLGAIDLVEEARRYNAELSDSPGFANGPAGTAGGRRAKVPTAEKQNEEIKTSPDHHHHGGQGGVFKDTATESTGFFSWMNIFLRARASFLPNRLVVLLLSIKHSIGLCLTTTGQ